ncbi:glycosyltransferase family 4 protein [Streptococcus sp. NLN64]|uniref:glycosyltransferase family 4 protein n=1 Tax=Streptococcus sp. NLN64 TaxID=2822799 RepID=UPI0018CBD038|nr:glycosyltransferase family 4 protein [Streptococcus sp. NLN64]MBG9367204.1 glycosyltransferase family 4 protein [Streptococcus sp. NLN64]
MKIVIPRIIYNRQQLKWDWSGTVTNLKKAFAEKGTLKEVNIFFNWRMKVYRVLRKLKLIRYDLNLFYIKEGFKNFSMSEDDVYITFDEIQSVASQSYIYQDLNLNYLIQEKVSNPESFIYSGFQGVHDTQLKKRSAYQNHYYENAAGIFSMSNWFADYLVEEQGLPSDKVHYVGAGLNIDIKQVDFSRKEGNKFLFVGKDFKRKGGDLVIKAFRNLYEQGHKNLELYIVGPEEMPVLADSPNIYFVGNIPADDLPKYFNLCDVFVLPSRFEAFGLVFVEALAYGLPCIGREMMEMKHFIKPGRNGFLINKTSEDSQELADIMLKVIKDDSVFEFTKETHQQIADFYSWNKVAERMMAVIEWDKR